MEIMHFIFKERRQWDEYLMKCRIVEQLDDHSEIFQYATGGHIITNYCVLRYATNFHSIIFDAIEHLIRFHRLLIFLISTLF